MRDFINRRYKMLNDKSNHFSLKCFKALRLPVLNKIGNYKLIVDFIKRYKIVFCVNVVSEHPSRRFIKS